MKRSGFTVMARLIGLVRPLAGYMALAVTMGLAGHLCATFLTVLGGFGILQVLGFDAPLPLAGLFVLAAVLAVLRAVLRYGEQACNHFIAFKLLALLRDKVFRALRRLAPAKLEGREKGDLISVITSDIELLEVFYAHTISPALIALLFSILLTGFIGSYHPLLGALALAAYAVVGMALPVAISRASGPDGLRVHRFGGAGGLCAGQPARPARNPAIRRRARPPAADAGPHRGAFPAGGTAQTHGGPRHRRYPADPVGL